MQNGLLFTLILLFCSPVFAAKDCEVPQNSKGLKHGKEICYHPNGKVQYETEWKNGKEDGKSLVFEPDGDLLIEQNYSGGLQHGEQKFYTSSNHTLSEIKNYAKGRRVGTWNTYFTEGELSGKIKGIKIFEDDKLKVEEELYPNGKTRFVTKYGKVGPISTEHFDEKGAPERFWKFNEETMISESRLFEKGKLLHLENKKGDSYHGMVVDYLADGREKSVLCYQDGVRMQGTFACDSGRKEGSEVVKVFYENGKERMHYTLEQGKKTGESIEYYPSGKIKEVQVYKDDKLEGIVKTYYPSEDLDKEIPYVNGKKQGEEKVHRLHSDAIDKVITWNRDKKEKEVTFHNNQKVATEKTWENKAANLKVFYENGTLKEEVEYVLFGVGPDAQEKKHGMQKKYYEDGKLYSTQSFVEDRENGLSTIYFNNGRIKNQTLYELGQILASATFSADGTQISHAGDTNRIPADVEQKNGPGTKDQSQYPEE